MTPPRTAEATFVQWVDDPSDPELFNFAKWQTYTQFAEHAVLKLKGGRMALFRGGAFGIDLLLDADGHVVVRVVDDWQRVRELVWHVHPVVTGPSDADRAFLRRLGQRRSQLWEVGGEPLGQTFEALKPTP